MMTIAVCPMLIPGEVRLAPTTRIEPEPIDKGSIYKSVVCVKGENLLKKVETLLVVNNIT